MIRSDKSKQMTNENLHMSQTKGDPILKLFKKSLSVTNLALDTMTPHHFIYFLKCLPPSLFLRSFHKSLVFVCVRECVNK